MRRVSDLRRAAEAAASSAPANGRDSARRVAPSSADAPERAAEKVGRAVILHDVGPTADLVRSLVEAAGFEASRVGSAIDLAGADGPTPPHLVVLGMTAVEERDVEIVSVLRKRKPDAWILVLYPLSLRERAAMALALGADASLAEPFYPSELTAHATRALARVARVAGAGAAPATSAVGVAAATDGASASSGPAGVAARLAVGVARSVGAALQRVERHLDAADSGAEVDVPAIRAELRGIAGVTDGLRRFAGHDGVALRPTDVAGLVTGVFLSRDIGAAGAEIGVRIGESMAEVLADPDLLRAGLEAVRNRAVRVTPPEGKISVRTRRRTDDGRRMVEISVTDGGPALTAEQRARLFDPFPDFDAGRTEDGAAGSDADAGRPDDGAGLAFAALAGIVRDHRGSVVALAAGATGTIVVIRLPACDDATADGADGAA